MVDLVPGSVGAFARAGRDVLNLGSYMRGGKVSESHVNHVFV